MISSGPPEGLLWPSAVLAILACGSSGEGAKDTLAATAAEAATGSPGTTGGGSGADPGSGSEAASASGTTATPPTLDCPDPEDPVCDAFDLDRCAEASPTHAGDMQPLWSATCLGGTCHVHTHVHFLVMEEDAYGVLVGVPSMNSPLLRVTPGEPRESYLWYKIKNAQLCPAAGGNGNKMPPLGANDMGRIQVLTDDDIRMIENWICCGAPP